jgi:hypothetical protein
MKTAIKLSLKLLVASAALAPWGGRTMAADLTPDSVPPVVIKTVPEAGCDDVTPGEYEIRVTFSREMMDGSWSWCTVWDGSTPRGLLAPRYSADHKTCILKVQLEPGQTYGYWLNTETYRHFQDPAGHAAVPYLLTFSTTGGAHAAATSQERAQRFIDEQLKSAKDGNYWAKFALWEAYAQGTHDVATNAAEADKWLPEVVKGAYLARFEPVNGFNPNSPEQMLSEFSQECGLFSGKNGLGGASFFRTRKQDGRLLGSFLTDSPDGFKAAIGRSAHFKLISVEKVTPQMFVVYEASPQESL